MRRSEAYALRRRIESAAGLLDDGGALGSADLFPAWKPGLAVPAGGRYRFGGVLYKAIQAHTTRAGWAPDITPALWARVSLDEWPEWVQPTGAQDAYSKGDKVMHNGSKWASSVDGNVWEPGVYGWEKVNQ